MVFLTWKTTWELLPRKYHCKLSTRTVRLYIYKAALKKLFVCRNRPLENEVGRSVGKFFFLLKFPTDRYFCILVVEAWKMVFFFCSNFFLYTIQKITLCLKPSQVSFRIKRFEVKNSPSHMNKDLDQSKLLFTFFQTQRIIRH